MTINLFLLLLTAFSTLTTLVVEAIKNLTTDKVNYSTNVLALIVALIVGIVGTATYYQLTGIVFDLNNIIYMLLIGLASALVSMTSYDKVKQAIEQIISK
ncbi:hypothetical protein [Konateibacter massiliensis]|uniref:hypothetical protein n=1 Tax=Konateibacter massiliensis TaxID=2002841 RepID=UPI000C159C6F|nr:hypothetical protein [Konateibacter massiliensis]